MFGRGRVDTAVRAARAEGELNATLREHDARLRSMAETIAHLADEMSKIVLEVQHLADNMRADRETAVRTSEAVRAAGQAAANAAEQVADTRARRRDFIVACAIVVSALIGLASLLVSSHVF